MAAQAAFIADTIVGMKKALRRENDHSGPDDPIIQPTNRGNKLRANAKYIHEGVLGFTRPQELYKEVGYTLVSVRPQLRNPPRYDSQGDELDENDADLEADVAAAEENPFSEITLERLLCPLKHPSELPSHPSMAHPYKSRALQTMTLAVEEKLRKERVLLWRAKNLHRQFIGDSCWIPCGKVETTEDRFIFEPRRINDGATAVSRRRGQSTTSQTDTRRHSDKEKSHRTINDDVDMTDAPHPEDSAKDGRPEHDAREPKTEDTDAMVDDLLQHAESSNSGAPLNSLGPSNAQLNGGPPSDQGTSPNNEVMDKVNGGKTVHEQRPIENRNIHPKGNEEEPQGGSSPEPPRRMTTRARANATNPDRQNGITEESPLSSVETLETIPSPHPLFLVPDSVRPDPDFGLPPNEAEETRRLLWSYIQKQDETVRGFEYMLKSLLRACRMKENVFEWCKAEGHVGEMSDGEDWYDREKWGLGEGEDLKKGADEEDAENPVDEGRATGKRGRGRR